jgi:hypothetical protein
MKISQKGDKPEKQKDDAQKDNISDISKRQSQKMLLMNAFNVISK